VTERHNLNKGQCSWRWDKLQPNAALLDAKPTCSMPWAHATLRHRPHQPPLDEPSPRRPSPSLSLLPREDFSVPC